MPAVTGSAATGQASGAAGLLMSYGRRVGTPLQPNEVKQLLTLTSQDVVPENTANGSSGVADPSQEGWDQHFGYGLPDLGLAMEQIDEGRIPPQALITGPDWFAPLNVERQDSVDVSGRVSARRADRYTYRLQWAPGIEPLEGDFVDVRERTRSGAFDGKLGTIDLEQVRDALDNRPGGGATNDPTAPGKGPGDVDPNEPAFTVRVVVTDDEGNRGEDRKMLFAYRDDTLLPGWSKAIGSGGEASMRMFNVDRGNQLEIVLADSSGRLSVLDSDGKPQPSFNQGKAVRTQTYPNVHSGSRIYRKVDPPREVLRTPAIGDIDGDLEPEIVDSAGEHVYAWHLDGKAVKGFPVRLDPDNSRPEDRTKQNHVKRGFTASPTLTDLDGDAGLEIFLPALDQHMYAWNGQGEELDGFPVKLQEDGTDTDQVPGAESINTAAVGDITGDDEPDIVAPTNEIDGASSPGDPQDAFAQLVAANAANAAGTEGRLYGLDADGDFLDDWPTKPTGLLPDALPFAGPGVDHVMGNLDGDPELEVVGNLSTGDVSATDGDGSNLRDYNSSQDSSAETVDKSKVLNLFENPILAEFDDVPGLDVIKGGLTLNQLVNIGVAVGQNLPYNHVVQAWNGDSGVMLPGFPQAVEDFQLLSSPAVADVAGGSEQEILLGTGLYLLRSINAQGDEEDDFPKFTGGWIFAVPTMGDADNDGNLDVATLTREGYAFAWSTDRPACGGNDQWWTSRHDEWSTGAHGTDTRPPGVAEDLKAKRDGDQTELTWKAPGDDHLCGQAERYRILASRKPIDGPGDGQAVGSDTEASDEPGDEVAATADLPNGTKFVAVLYQDDAGNWGMVSRQAKL